MNREAQRRVVAYGMGENYDTLMFMREGLINAHVVKHIDGP